MGDSQLVFIDGMALARTNEKANIATASSQVERNEIIDKMDIFGLEDENVGTPQKYAVEKVVADSQDDDRTR